jgi:flagellar hook-length control protein FliK
MQIAQQIASSGTNSLQGGIFSANTGASGLFGLFLSLFGQHGSATGLTSGLTDGALGTGQNLPGTNPLLLNKSPNGLTNLPADSALAGLLTHQTAQNTSATPTDITDTTTDQNALLSFLSGLLAQAGASETMSDNLKALLAQANTSSSSADSTAVLQTTLDGLTEDQRDALMSELAALFQQMPAQPVMPTPISTNFEDAPETANSADIGNIPAASPLLTAQRQPDMALASEIMAATDAATSANETFETTLAQAGAALHQSQESRSDAASHQATIQTAAAHTAHTNQSELLRQIRNLEARHRQGDAILANDSVQQANTISDTATMTAAAASTLSESHTLARTLLRQANDAHYAATADANSQTQNTASSATSPGPTSAAGQNTSTPLTSSGKVPVSDLLGTGNDLSTLQPLTSDPGAQLPLHTQAAHTPKAAASTFNLHLQEAGTAQASVTDQVSVHLTRALNEGHDRFTVKLSPAELGRIEIRIDMGSDGKVNASFQVDQPATLDLLQKDQKGLERLLTDAGLKADSGSLNFNLRGDGQNGQQGGSQQQALGQDSQGQGNSRSGGMNSQTSRETEAVPAGLIEATWYTGTARLDLHV